MLNDISRARMAATWVAAAIVMGACSVVWGIDLTVNNGEWWLGACLAPPMVMLLVGQSFPSIAVAVARAANKAAFRP